MKKKILPVIIIIALIIIIGLAYAGQIAYEHFSYSKEKADLNEYYGVSDSSQAVFIWKNMLMDEKAVVSNEEYYLDLDTVHNYISKRFYYGAADGVLIYTGPTEIYTANIGSTAVRISSGESSDLGYIISYIEGDKVYVACKYLMRYTNISYECSDSDGISRIRIYSGEGDEMQVGELKKTVALRKLGGRKSEVVSYASGTVTVIEQMDEWSRVISSDQHIGYVENKNIKNVNETIHNGVSSEEDERVSLGEYTSLSIGSKINMGFHPIGGVAGNETVSGILEQTKSMNVIAPTWMSLSDTEGNISCYATHDYITAARAKGMQVWAVLDNFNNPNKPDTETVLSHAASRANLISNLMQQQAEYGFEGINVDFELIDESYGQDYIEFLRELSVACRKNQVILSIDDYVPMDFNDHYDLVEQGIVADYVIIMGYDEHYAGSDTAGSVASIGYVEKGIQKALEQVSAEKLINAIPFYTRLWTTSGGSVSSKALHMSGATNVISEKGIEMKWDEETCQYYGEVTDSNGDLYQIWNEEARSIEAKLSVMQAHGVAGVAEWALGFETADIWDVISAYMAQ